MNELATQLALDQSALRAEIHQAQEGDGNGECEEGGEVGVHEAPFQLAKKEFNAAR